MPYRKNIEIKFIRNTLFTIFKDYNQTKKREDKTINSDPNSKAVMKIIQLIKDQVSIEIFINKIVKLIPGFNKDKHIDYDLLNKLPKTDVYQIFSYIMLKNVFKEFSFIVSSMIFNNLYFKEKDKLLILYNGYQEKIYDSMQSKELFETVIKEIEKAHEGYYKETQYKKLEEIEKCIKEIPVSELQMFKITDIYVYGSFAKGTQNSYSDVDILVEMNTDTSYDVIKILVKNLFVKYLNTKIDVTIHKKNEPIKGFIKNILEYAKHIKST
ncbi:nucleotidyltransferase domain-containing protein [Acholeplasma equirhinis]|uniref:nucleotidyltransferase family protein n=1 Tax=Acholeplasma equirhinis TaxID=555393 RepID=UPI00197ADB0B|nr:nucleotidyltransferase domain-containing protein [Acholeplasma equirhinis]MBN3490234.1 nucleotidyltransferase domain-containing protein [Acholeplasma equirhinis]